MRTAIIGLGKLGLPMLAVFASRGIEVVGIDSNKEVVSQIASGKCPIIETGLERLLTVARGNFAVSTDYEATKHSQVIFTIVPTPSDKNGCFSNDYILGALEQLDTKALVVIASTVMPNTMEKVVLPKLREKNKNAVVCYNPHLIALGSVIRDIEHPDVILIGESSKEAGDILESFYNGLFAIGDKPPICRTNLINAEIAKIALNAYITTKISFANTLAMLCNKVPGCDVDKVTGFLGLDSRIGGKYLRGGLGFGGTCFPRDNKAFTAFAQEYDCPLPIQQATVAVNNEINRHITEQILSIVPETCTISILGLTYKTNTPVVEESMSLDLASILSEFYKAKVYDPMGMESAKRLCPNLIYCKDIAGCLANSQLCILATPWREFMEMEPEDFSNMEHKRIYDCWRAWDREELSKAGIEYHAFGVNSG